MKTLHFSALLFMAAACVCLPARSETVKTLHLSTPLVLSASYGWAFGGETGPRNLVELEAGLGGGKILLGRDTMGPGFGYGLKASLMRTWLVPLEVDEDQLYLGLELQVGNGTLLGSLGGYRRIEGDDEDWLATFGLGFRF